MILIEEKTTEKIPGLTSLFVSFNYNPTIIEAIKCYAPKNYNKKTKEWEFPITALHFLINNLSPLEDIKLNLKPDNFTTEQKLISSRGDHYKTKPFDYQLDGIQFGLNHDKWLLLDAPGLGKSLQIIYLAERLKELKGIEHCLIICGVNTLKYNWKKEIETHSKLDCHILGEKLNKKGNPVIGSVEDRLNDLKKPLKEFFLITNIETLRNDSIIKELTNSKINKFDMIAVDEVHKCKDPQSQQGKNLLKLKAPYMIAATGTLLLNNPIDAYVPMKWVGVEKSNNTNFKSYYCNYEGPFNNIFTGYKNLDHLKYQLDSCSLRRTKDLLDLPPKSIINEYVDMDPKQEKFYANIKNGVKAEANKVDLKTTNLLAMVGRLRQASDCPSILTTENIPSAKLDRACELTNQLIGNGEKVVIFTTYKESISILSDKLKEYNPLICTGDIKDNIISDNIDKFQNDPTYKLLIATHSKLATGVTLTASSYQIVISPPWTKALCEQMEDRIYRIGSKNPVFIYYLWTHNTIDDHVKEIIEDKGIISDYIIDDKISPHTLERLRNLIIDL